MPASTEFNSRYVVPANHNPRDPTPTALTHEGYIRIEQLSREGHGWESIAGQLGISATTLKNMRKRDPSIVDAFLLGKGNLDTEITTLLLKQARDGNTAAQIFLAKAKLGWREVGPSADAPTNATQVNIYVSEPLSDEQFAKLTHAPVGDDEA